MPPQCGLCQPQGRVRGTRHLCGFKCGSGLLCVCRNADAITIDLPQAQIAGGISGFCGTGQVVNGLGSIHRNSAAARIKISQMVQCPAVAGLCCFCQQGQALFRTGVSAVPGHERPGIGDLAACHAAIRGGLEESGCLGKVLTNAGAIPVDLTQTQRAGGVSRLRGAGQVVNGLGPIHRDRSAPCVEISERMKCPAVVRFRQSGEQLQSLFGICIRALSHDKSPGVGDLSVGIAAVCGRLEEGKGLHRVSFNTNAIPVHFAQPQRTLSVSSFRSLGQIVESLCAVRPDGAVARIEVADGMKCPLVAACGNLSQHGQSFLRARGDALSIDEGKGIIPLARRAAAIGCRLEKACRARQIGLHTDTAAIHLAKAERAGSVSSFRGLGQILKGLGTIHRHRATPAVEITQGVKGIPVARRRCVFQLLQGSLKRGPVLALLQDLAQFPYVQNLLRRLRVTVRSSSQ